MKSKDRVDTLHDYFASQDKRYEQRFADAQRAVDIAFAAQQIGLAAALTSQKEAVAAALFAADRAVVAALSSANEAVQKAEGGTERRFAAMDDFRLTLADQQRTLMPRLEVEVLIKGLKDRILVTENAVRQQTEISTSVLALKQGQEKGLSVGWGMAVGIIGFVVAVLSIILMLRKP